MNPKIVIRSETDADVSAITELIVAARINDQWRVCFCWTDAGAENVEIIDYH